MANYFIMPTGTSLGKKTKDFFKSWDFCKKLGDFDCGRLNDKEWIVDGNDLIKETLDILESEFNKDSFDGDKLYFSAEICTILKFYEKNYNLQPRYEDNWQKDENTDSILLLSSATSDCVLYTNIIGKFFKKYMGFNVESECIEGLKRGDTDINKTIKSYLKKFDKYLEKVEPIEQDIVYFVITAGFKGLIPITTSLRKRLSYADFKFKTEMLYLFEGQDFIWHFTDEDILEKVKEIIPVSN